VSVYLVYIWDCFLYLPDLMSSRAYQVRTPSWNPIWMKAILSYTGRLRNLGVLAMRGFSGSGFGAYPRLLIRNGG